VSDFPNFKSRGNGTFNVFSENDRSSTNPDLIIALPMQSIEDNNGATYQAASKFFDCCFNSYYHTMASTMIFSSLKQVIFLAQADLRGTYLKFLEEKNFTVEQVEAKYQLKPNTLFLRTPALRRRLKTKEKPLRHCADLILSKCSSYYVRPPFFLETVLVKFQIIQFMSTLKQQQML
jgi:hypothetical protein